VPLARVAAMPPMLAARKRRRGPQARRRPGATQYVEDVAGYY